MPVYFWLPVLGSIGIGFIYMSAPPVADQFMNIFSLGYGGLSFFLSSIYLTHSFVKVPAGLLIDRIGVFYSLPACIAVCLIGSLGPLIRPDNLAVAVLFRLILGMSTGAMFLLFVKIVQILAPPRHVARAQGVQGAAFCLGHVLPYLVLTRAGAYGWLAAYLSGAVLCAALCACMFRLPRAPLKASSSTANTAAIRQAVKTIFASRHIWFLGCSNGFSFGSLITIGNWLPAVLADAGMGSAAEGRAVATSAILLIGAAGRIFSGDVSRLMPRQLVIRRATLCIGALYALLGLADSPVFAILVAAVLAVLCGSTYAAVFTLTIDISPPSYVATAVGFMTMLATGMTVMLILLLGNAREFSGGFGLGLGLAALGATALYAWGHCIRWPGGEKA